MLLTLIKSELINKEERLPNGRIHTKTYWKLSFIDESKRLIVSFGRESSIVKYRIKKSFSELREVIADYGIDYHMWRNMINQPTLGDVFSLDCSLGYYKEFDNYKIVGKLKKCQN